MTAFLKDITSFIGDGSVNEKGQTLEEFLAEYDPNRYQNPCVSADILVFRHSGCLQTINQGLKLLMVQRKNHPSIGRMALPGGFAEIHEDLEQSAKRELEEETGLRGVPMEQLYTWGEEWRDPRARIITTAYLALVDDTVSEPKAGDDAAQVMWADVELRELSTELSISGCEKCVYELILTGNCDGKKVSLRAVVCRTQQIQGLLYQTSYEVLENDGIAFDHPRFIVQALCLLKERLQRKE